MESADWGLTEAEFERFWQDRDVQHACVERDLSRVLQLFRSRAFPGRKLPQQTFARLIGLDQGDLSRIERGQRSVPKVGKLISIANALRMPRFLRWFDSQPLLSGGFADLVQLAGWIPEHAAVDRMLGPRSLSTLVPAAVEAALARHDSDRVAQDPVLRSAAMRVLEFTSWIHQESGDLAAADGLISRAAALADREAADDFRWYVLVRRFEVAAVRSPSHKTASALVEVIRALPGECVPQRAYGLKTLALTYARMRDRARADRVLAEVERVSGIQADRDLVDPCAFVTGHYLMSEWAQIELALGRHREVLDSGWRPAASWALRQRRDYTVATARIALAHAMDGDAPTALSILRGARMVIEDVRSFKLSGTLRRLAEEFAKIDAWDELQMLRDEFGPHFQD